MEEFEPKKKTKIISKEFIMKYSYVFVLAILLIGGISYGYTFFTENRKIASGSITTANLTINFTNRSISASSLSIPANDKEGLVEFVKSVTITNQTSIDGRVKLTLTRTSGLELTDLRYALVINGAIQEINDVPTSGLILSSAIMGSEVINVEVRLWPKTTYTGSETTFVGELTPEIKYLGSKATTSIANPAGKYVNFNCNGNNCEVWQIVKVEDDRLVLTRQSDYSGATSRTNSNKYDSNLTFNDDSLITSVSTDGKNGYLARTVKIDGGNGTQDNPYKLTNQDFREDDKKVIAVITYKDDNNNTVGTQNVYYNETNYISQIINDSDFQGWNDGTNNYELGDVVNFTSDTNLTAVMLQRLITQIMTKCNDNDVSYVKKYNIAKGLPIDTPDGTGNEDVCYYTTTSTDRNSDAEQNSNVIFGDYCWQIVRTTADGGVKLLYNGLKTTNNRCTSDADTENYTSNPRPSIEGVTGTYHISTNISGNKKYGTGFELYDDNGTTKFQLTGVSTGNWESDFASLIGKYTCMNNTDEICTKLYYVGHRQSSTNASTVSYTVSTPAHYSQLGTSPFNAEFDSLALVGYMYNDVYRVTKKTFSEASSDVINRESSPSAYYYGDMAVWVSDHYELRINTGTEENPIYTDSPSSTTIWADIRSTVGGKYTCKKVNNVAVTSCTTVYYVVDNSNNSYMYSVPLSNNETKDKQVTWTYGTGITKSGNNYILTGTNTLTFKLVDWYTDYSNSQYKNIYLCDDFTSTTCTVSRFITNTSNYQETYVTMNYTYYFASDISYDSNTKTYSYDSNGTIVEVYDWYHQYNTLNSNHYMCENYDSVNNTCGTNNPIYYLVYTENIEMHYAILEDVPNIETAIVNMLNKDVGITVNRYNSAIKGVIDNWYKQNIDDKNLSIYLDNDAVFCNDRTITSFGSWSKTGSTTNILRFKYQTPPTSYTTASLVCENVTDRFSKTNEKALLTYSVGLLSEAEQSMMRGYARTGQIWWLGSPHSFNKYISYGCSVSSSGSFNYNYIRVSHGVRPAIVLKPGITISGGNGTYDSPYIVDATFHT